jgi:D-alanyl-D-alanine carboxypeptidase/D-alanyl-D-alanine-endopeptidase (penicillin-binding protein 4)
MDKDFSDNIVDGNIYLKGYGDPNLTTADLDSLAFAVRRSGIAIITGNVVVDDSYFDDNYWGAGWTWDDESDPDAPYINALSVNSNCIKVSAISDSTSTFIYLEPMTDFITIINKAMVSNNPFRAPLKIRRLALNNPNTILIEGELPRFGQVTKTIALRQPEYYVGTLFKESLRHAGVIVYGDVANGVVPNGLLTIAQHSQPIEAMIINMNKVSDNLSAENTLKVLGAKRNGIPGSAKSGLSIIKLFLSNLGMDTTKFYLADGSGVSRYNLLSTDQLVQLLSEMYKQQKIFPMFYNSLPIAGVDGTLAERMKTYPVACNLRAKTGTLNGVSCLSGYVQSRDGEMLVFSIIMQNYITSTSDYRQVQDRIGVLLAEFSRYAPIQIGQ